jgi:hypothetical protein
MIPFTPVLWVPGRQHGLPDKACEATLISEYPTAADAFAELDRLSARMGRTVRRQMRLD